MQEDDRRMLEARGSGLTESPWVLLELMVVAESMAAHEIEQEVLWF